jgi:hypothetical protein
MRSSQLALIVSGVVVVLFNLSIPLANAEMFVCSDSQGVNTFTNAPIHSRCQRLIEEVRLYRCKRDDGDFFYSREPGGECELAGVVRKLAQASSSQYSGGQVWAPRLRVEGPSVDVCIGLGVPLIPPFVHLGINLVCGALSFE